MRSSTITSSFASVVTFVIQVSAAAVASRSLLSRHMREHTGYRLGTWLDGMAWLLKDQSLMQQGNLLPQLHKPAHALACGIAAPAVCYTPRLSQTRGNWRG